MGVLGVFALHAVLASATQQIEWSTTEGCPSPAEIQRRTERLLGAQLAAYDRTLIAKGWVEPSVGGHALELSIVVDGHREHHSLRAIDCERLGTDAALLIASAIDPFARGPETADLDQRELIRPFDRPPPIQRPRRRPPQRPRRPSPVETAVPPTPAPTPEPARAEPALAVRDVDDAPEPSRARARDLHGFIGSAGLGFAGVFPSPSGGVAIEGGLERGRLRWQLGAQGWFGGRFRADTTDLGADLTAWTGSTSLCFVPRTNTVHFPLCGTVGAGAMVATAVGTVEARTSVQPWVFAGADLRVNWTPRPAVGLYAGLAVLPALARASWTVTNPDASFRVGAVTGLLRLGVEWRARSTPRRRNSPNS